MTAIFPHWSMAKWPILDKLSGFEKSQKTYEAISSLVLSVAARLVSTSRFLDFSTILSFSFLVSISRLVSCLEIQAKMGVLWHEIVKNYIFHKNLQKHFVFWSTKDYHPTKSRNCNFFLTFKIPKLYFYFCIPREIFEKNETRFLER